MDGYCHNYSDLLESAEERGSILENNDG